MRGGNTVSICTRGYDRDRAQGELEIVVFCGQLHCTTSVCLSCTLYDTDHLASKKFTWPNSGKCYFGGSLVPFRWKRHQEHVNEKMVSSFACA